MKPPVRGSHICREVMRYRLSYTAEGKRECCSWTKQGDSPEPHLSLEHALVAPDTEIHHPVIEVSAKQFADYDCNLQLFVSVRCRTSKVWSLYDWSSIGASHSVLTESVSNRWRGAKEDGVRSLRVLQS